MNDKERDRGRRGYHQERNDDIRRHIDNILNNELDHRLRRELDHRLADYVRKDTYEIRLEQAREQTAALAEKMEKFLNERTWLVRLVLGANVMAVIGLILNGKGVL